MQSVQPQAASFSSASPSGTGVRPASRVRIALWLRPGMVNSVFNAAAAANTLLTPGTTL